jgi:hypothetical protein
MELFTKESGSTTKPKAKELFGMLRVIYTPDNSRQIRLMGSEFILMSMVPDMKENGSTMYKKVKEKKHGLMEPSM